MEWNGVMKSSERLENTNFKSTRNSLLHLHKQNISAHLHNKNITDAKLNCSATAGKHTASDPEL